MQKQAAERRKPLQTADPGYTTLEAQAPFKWSGSDLPENASLQLVKAGAGGAPQEKAGSTLTAGCTEVVG